MIRALLWKDLRIQRPGVLAAIAIVTMPYVYAFVEWIRYDQELGATWIWRTTLATAGSLSLMGSLLVVAMLSGTTFAAERSDRSSNFLCALPVGRYAIAGSKLIVAIVVIVVMWVSNPSVILRIASWIGITDSQSYIATDPTFGVLVAMTIAIFGVGWFGSTLVSNPASSLLIGMLAPFFVLLLSVAWYGTANNTDALRIAFQYGCVLLGLVGFVTGSVVFLRFDEY